MIYKPKPSLVERFTGQAEFSQVDPSSDEWIASQADLKRVDCNYQVDLTSAESGLQTWLLSSADLDFWSSVKYLSFPQSSISSAAQACKLLQTS